MAELKPWEMEWEVVEPSTATTPSSELKPWEMEWETDLSATQNTPTSGLPQTLVGALRGEQAQPSPFGDRPTELTPAIPTEPQLQLGAQRDIQGVLTEEEIKARQAGDIKQSVENLYSRYGTTGKQIGGVFNREMRKEAEAEVRVVNQQVLNELNSRGIKAKYNRDGELEIINDDGTSTLASGSLFRELYKYKWEMAGAAGGALAGARLGAFAGTPGQVVGGLAGSAIGAFSGSGLDAMANNIDLVNKANDDVILDKMTDAGITDIVLGGVGAGAAKAAVGTGRLAKRIFDLVFQGNTQGAAKHLYDHFGVTKEEAMERVAKVEQLVGPLRGTDEEKAIQALTQTYRGGEGVVQAATALDPKASANMANQIFKRADDVLQQSKKLSADNVQTIVNQNMARYTDEVKAYYRNVKEAPKEFTKNYRFNFDDLGIKPLTDSIGNRIEDPRTKERFANLLTRIENASEGRTFQDLIDLRQAVNDIKFSKKTLKYTDSQALNKVINTIDSEIAEAGKVHIPSYDTWAKSWTNAKSEYSKMKDLESNVLFRALSKPGVNESTVVKAFSRYISAGDNTFYDVMEKLPKPVQNKVEGSVFNDLVERYTAGDVGTNRAVHFPQLSKELKKVSWKSPKVKQQVRALNRMSEVFTNDVNLARVSGRIQIPEFQSYLTTDPIVRLKYEIASSIFNKVKQYSFTDEANALALVKSTGRLLENPLHERNFKDLMRTLPRETRTFREKLEFEPTLQALQQQYIERVEGLKKIYNKETIPPRLVWKKPLEAPVNELDRIDSILYSTLRGTTAEDPSAAVMKDRADDLVADFIWQNSNTDSQIITDRVEAYMDDRRYSYLLDQVAKKAKVDSTNATINMLENIAKRDAEALIGRIQFDFGVSLPPKEAEKLIALKIKELYERSK